MAIPGAVRNSSHKNVGHGMQGILTDKDIRTASISGFDPIAKNAQISQFEFLMC